MGLRWIMTKCMDNQYNWDKENEDLKKLAAEIRKNVAMLEKIRQMEGSK